MASIVKRKNSYCVVYNYVNGSGVKKQKWETYKSLSEAKARKREVEYKQEFGVLVIGECKTVNELLDEYVSLYGKNKWAVSTYQGNVSLIDHYIRPFIGEMKLADLNARTMQKFYLHLSKSEAVPAMAFGSKMKPKDGEKHLVTPNTVQEVHKVLRSCFSQAVAWELMERNPCQNVTLPKVKHNRREIWTAETLFHAIDVCEDERLKLALNLTFSCSLRIGELMGLTWDCIDISPASIKKGMASIQVTKELQRVSREVLDILENKDVLLIFPGQTSKSKTLMVLKPPKTETSVRRIYLPKTVALMLVEWKAKQDETKAFLGSEYTDYNLVFAGPLGFPVTPGAIRKSLRELIEKNDLPPVVFHSFRHASITYKLKLNGGDIKAVQGDSGHSQAKMVTDLYSHVLDESRVHNAELFEDAFYGKKVLDVVLDTEGGDQDDGMDDGADDEFENSLEKFGAETDAPDASDAASSVVSKRPENAGDDHAGENHIGENHAGDNHTGDSHAGETSEHRTFVVNHPEKRKLETAEKQVPTPGQDQESMPAASGNNSQSAVPGSNLLNVLTSLGQMNNAGISMPAGNLQQNSSLSAPSGQPNLNLLLALASSGLLNINSTAGQPFGMNQNQAPDQNMGMPYQNPGMPSVPGQGINTLELLKLLSSPEFQTIIQMLGLMNK